MKWTHFHDMRSGGGLKEKWGHIYIEAPEKEAKIIFFNRFGHNPERVTCPCCGEDYSSSEYDTLEDATGYERMVRVDKHLTVKEFEQKPGVLIIRAKSIKPQERIGEVPAQGDVWVE